MHVFNNLMNYFIRGNIEPRRFCKGDPANDFSALPAGLGDVTIGISQPGPIDPPGVVGSTTKAGSIVAKTMQIYGPGAVDIQLEAGVGGYGRFEFVKPDAQGRGIPCAQGDLAGAYTLEECHGPGKYGRVIVLFPGTVANAAGALPSSSSVSASI